MSNETKHVVPANGTWTVQRTDTGARRTFRLRTVREGDLAGKRIVEILSGPENTADYMPVAFIGDDGRVGVFRKKQNTAWAGQAVWFGALLRGELPAAHRDLINVLEARSCRRCNRLLTTPASIEAGIGPECAAREE